LGRYCSHHLGTYHFFLKRGKFGKDPLPSDMQPNPVILWEDPSESFLVCIYSSRLSWPLACKYRCLFLRRGYADHRPASFCAAVVGEEAAEGKIEKKKKGGKAVGEEEDLDALLASFGVSTDAPGQILHTRL
jgi:hypothetical protein